MAKYDMHEVGPVDIIYNNLINDQVLKDLRASGMGPPVRAINPPCEPIYVIEFTIIPEHKGRPLPPLLYRMTLSNDRIVMTVLDGLSKREFLYCDPNFPQNLLQELSEIRRANKRANR